MVLKGYISYISLYRVSCRFSSGFVIAFFWLFLCLTDDFANQNFRFGRLRQIRDHLVDP